MFQIIELSKNVKKIVSDSDCYIIEESIVIDTSRRELKEELLTAIKSIINPDKIKKVIFTHLHYDHIGNFDLFKNAEFFASKNAVEAVQNHNTKSGFILDPYMTDKFDIPLKNIEEDKELKNIFEITKTPGHCESCIILYYKKDNILFTGDTYFREGSIGRTDLPTSTPQQMQQSQDIVHELIKEHNPIIAPGHDY